MLASTEKPAKAPPVLSIIITAYNTESRLPRCLDSVLAQTFADWECFCVDNGCTDKSGDVMEEYAAKDSRFVVIHKKYGNPGSGRNVAIEKARGEYISLIDSDDWLEPDLYEAAIDTARQTDADIVVWRSIFEKKDGSTPSREVREGFFDPLQDSRDCGGLLWNKLFKAALIFENQIRAPEDIQPGDDDIFSYMCYVTAKKCYFINRPLYHFDRTNETSVMHVAKYNKEFYIKKAEATRRACEHISGLRARGATGEDDKKRKKEVSYFLLQLQVNTKASFLSGLPEPDFDLFRNTFPEVNRQLLYYFFKTRTPGSLIALLAAWRLHAPARALIRLKKKIKG